MICNGRDADLRAAAFHSEDQTALDDRHIPHQQSGRLICPQPGPIAQREKCPIPDSCRKIVTHLEQRRCERTIGAVVADVRVERSAQPGLVPDARVVDQNVSPPTQDKQAAERFLR